MVIKIAMPSAFCSIVRYNRVSMPADLSCSQGKLIAQDIAEAAKYKNVFCKLSGLINEVPFWSIDSFKPYVHHCLAVFGVSRCMFGSDWPVCKLAKPFADYGKVLKLLEDLTEHLSPEEKDCLFFKNVVAFYGLDIGE